MRAGSNLPDADNGYDVRGRHPERHEYYAKFAELSRSARHELPNFLDLSYGEGLRETLDVFPAGRKAPVVIFIHGGYWQAHDKSEFSFVSKPLVEASAATVVANYARAPELPIPELVGQIRACCAWVYANAARFSIDPDRIYVCGHSAGAHLAAAALSADWAARALPPDLVKGACLVSGIFDLAPLRGTSIGNAVGLDGAIAELASPVRMKQPEGATLLIAVGGGESEAFITQARAMARISQRSGSCVELQILDRMNHYDTVLALGERKSDTVRRFLEIIRRGG